MFCENFDAIIFGCYEVLQLDVLYTADNRVVKVRYFLVRLKSCAHVYSRVQQYFLVTLTFC